jgi:hypothetical protein
MSSHRTFAGNRKFVRPPGHAFTTDHSSEQPGTSIIIWRDDVEPSVVANVGIKSTETKKFGADEQIIKIAANATVDRTPLTTGRMQRHVSFSRISRNSRIDSGSDTEPESILGPPTLPVRPISPQPIRPMLTANNGRNYARVTIDWEGGEHGELDVFEGDLVQVSGYQETNHITTCHKLTRKYEGSTGYWQLSTTGSGSLPTIFLEMLSQNDFSPNATFN